MKRQREDRAEADYATTTRASMTMRRARNREEARPLRMQEESRPLRIVVRPDAERPLRPPLVTPPAQRRFVLPHRLQLPSHYVQQQQQHLLQHYPQPQRGTRRQARTEHRRRQPQSLPIFDNAPGDNTLSASSYPIFVYNGSRGELLVNTMLSTQRYPMQEPVPGQVLYPPSTPMFRPKPIVERFRLPGQRELLNLTLIPFYAHEAITAAPLTTSSTSSSTTTTAATDFPTEVTSVLEDLATSSSAAVPLSLTTPLPAATPYETQLPRTQRKRHPKKVKQYNAYHSPQEVVQRPPSLRSSPPLPAPDNHRHQLMDASVSPLEEQQEEQEEEQLEEVEQLEEFETELQMPSQELEQAAQPEHTTASTGSSSSSSSSSLQIVYVDESVESPSDTEASTTTAPQRQSSRYALKREYFAFPVYTLGKLLQDPAGSHKKFAKDHILQLDGSTENSSTAPNDSQTWFVLNSR